MKLLSLLAQYFTNRAQGSLFTVLAPIGPLIKQLSLGIGSFVMSIVCFLFTLLFFALSFFFYLIDRGEWSVAGLWTCILFGLIGLLFSLIGRSMINTARKFIR